MSPPDAPAAPAEEGPYLLDLATRSITRPAGRDLAAPASIRFVQVDINEVVNPKRLRLTFEVHDRHESGESVLLGTFALFPPDHPGTFLVSTKGLLRAGDAIVLSMQVLDEPTPQDVVRVQVERISFRRE